MCQNGNAAIRAAEAPPPSRLAGDRPSPAPAAALRARGELVTAIAACERLMVSLISARDAHDLGNVLGARDAIGEAHALASAIARKSDVIYVACEAESTAKLAEMGVVA